MITIYHNTMCSKSRGVCDILKQKKIKAKTIEYMHTPPTEEELKELLQMLGMKASELVRTKEPLYKEKYEGKKISNARWIKILCKNPILIERPILVKGNKAIVGRPEERVIEFLKN
ncbi:MAG: arsenate reductase (glutaredoxin) [Bacteroidia bacterium]